VLDLTHRILFTEFSMEYVQVRIGNVRVLCVPTG
jgi:hypothetical protein